LRANQGEVDMKLCKDCKHWNGKKTCVRPTGRVSVITGNNFIMTNNCGYERAIPAWLGGCGKRAKHFEHKEGGLI